MASDVERALWAFEEAVEGVLGFVRAAEYGLRLATKRVADLVNNPAASAAQLGPELAAVRGALEAAPDRLTDVAVLALGDHFRAFLARALGLRELPPLPETTAGVETLAGTPGALAKAPPWVPLFLQLYRAALRGGPLDRRALEALGESTLELRYPGGKVKLVTAGDRVTLTEGQFEDLARALVEAARAIELRLLTA
ncbi:MULTISPECIES: hypothetical protein [Deferrisoma]